MNLVIVESPTKAKVIQKYLGSDYTVLASGGHIRDLPDKTLGIEIENDFKPKYVLSPSKKETVKKIKDAASKADNIYLATDPDREGEAISWHLATVLNLTNPQRIEFNAITKSTVTNAIKSPRQLDMNLVDAQQARRVLDRLVGYKISPVLNAKIKKGLSGGRVQSAALKMVVDRENEIRNFTPEEFWTLTAILSKAGKKSSFKALFNDIDGKKFKVTNATDAESIEKAVKNADFIVSSVKKGESISKPNPPFTTSTLQQDGANKLSFSASEVMKLAQQLYEGVKIDDQYKPLVTYIRTDSVRVSPEAQQMAKDYILKEYGNAYVPAKFNFYTSKGDTVQDAHEAIRPIDLTITPDSIKDKIEPSLYKLYRLIYNRFLASQMTPAQYDTLKVHIIANSNEDNKEYGFNVSGKTMTFNGFTAVYNITTDNDDSDEENQNNLPSFVEGEKLDLKELKKEQKFTKPLPRYNDASLIKAMEENGIGRPATYANVLSVLAARKYTEKKKKFLVPTELGELVNKFMENNFSNIVDVKFTAQMEARLDEIDKGLQWQKVIRDFYPDFEQAVKSAYSSGNELKVKPQETDIICDKCGAKMIIRESKYGKFLACPNYPKCKNTKNFPVGKCPMCGGNIIKYNTTKRNVKTTYFCESKCGLSLSFIPAPFLCPDCEGILTTSKEDKTKYTCTKCGKTIDKENNN
ncbi:MAG: type I DNA topoisomerase [Clostridia bacterium]|nr:type I DNA topoisomerase [Clostridia bacterium]